MATFDPFAPVPVTDAMRAEYDRTQQLLRDVTLALQAQNVPAEYWHSGGGIFTITIDIGDYVWDFGTNAGDDGHVWGWDFSHGEDGHIISGDLLDGDMIAVPDDTPTRVVAQCIAHRLKKGAPTA